MNLLSTFSVFGSVFLAACAIALDLERFQQIPNLRASAALGDATVEIMNKSRANSVNIFTATVNQKNKYSAEEQVSYILNKLGGSVSYQLHVISNEAPTNDVIENMGSFSLFFVDGHESFR